MSAFSNFINRFRRVTSSGRYLPEVDGLRFIAIFFVVGLAHGGSYVPDAVLEIKDKSPYIYEFLLEGVSGVSLFFIISGFILTLPFAGEKLLQQQPVSLKKYYWRRVTRLEPAYIISLTLFFILRIVVMHYESFSESFPHYLASLFYVHNIVYNDHSTINGVAWSLEVEIQFYMLMPLIAWLYFTGKANTRRMVLSFIIIAAAVFSYSQQYHIGNIFNKACYFLGGILIADIYLLNKRNYDAFAFTILGAGCFIISLFVPAYYHHVLFCVGKLVLMLVYVFFVLTNATLKKWLSNSLITIIGGMCYSIYLLHSGILGYLRHHFAKIHFVSNNAVNAGLHYAIAMIIVLFFGAVFFLLVEKPTMRPDWYKRIFKRRGSVAS